MEQQQRVKKIQEHYQNLEDYNELESEYGIDVDSINSFESGNKNINTVINNLGMENYCIEQLKIQQLLIIRGKTEWNIDEKYPQEWKIIDTKWQEVYSKNISKDPDDIIDNPEQGLKLADAISKMGVVDNYEKFVAKEILLKIISRYKKREDSIIKYDDYGWNNKTDSLENDNISITKDGNNFTIKNTLTGQSEIINKESLKNNKKIKEQEKKDRELINQSKLDLMVNKLGLKEEADGKTNKEKSDLVYKKYKTLSDEKRLEMRYEIGKEGIKNAFTKNKDLFDAHRRRMDNNMREKIIVGGQAESMNEIIKLIEPDAKFDCTNSKSIMKTIIIEEENEDGKKVKKNVFQIKQGRNTVNIGFNEINEDIIENTEKSTNKWEVEGQKEIKESGLTLEQAKIDNPDINRALYSISNPEINEYGNIPTIDLQGFYLNSKQIKTLIPKLESVEGDFRLDLGYNNLEHIPEDLFTINNLKNLDVSGNYLESIPKIDGGNLDHIENINLGNNNIKYLSNIDQFENLTDLSLSGNNISNISKLSEMDKIESLNLSGNKVSNISDLMKIGNMKELYLSSNEISEIPKDFGHDKLKILSLSRNKLTNESKINLSEFDNLIDLNLSYNKFSELPLYGKSQSLRKFSFRGNEVDGENFPQQLKDRIPRVEDVNFYDHVLTGEEAKDRFLSGYYSQRGFDINNKNAQELSNFFNDNKNIAYGIGQASNEFDAQQEAKDGLKKLHMDDNNIHYINRKTGYGYETYAFTGADELSKKFL